MGRMCDGISVISLFMKRQSGGKPFRRMKMAPPAMRMGENLSLFHVVNRLASSLGRQQVGELPELTFCRSAVWEPWRNVLW